MTTLKSLQITASTKRQALHTAKNERSNERAIRMAVIDDQLKFDGYDQRIIAADIEVKAADDAVTIEQERLAVAGVECPVPLGSKVAEWKSPSWRSYSSSKSMSLTGQTGVVEAVTRASVFATNQSAPSVGSYVIRVNKKDGTPSLKFVSMSGWAMTASLPYGWHPEGINPNKEKA